VRVGYHSKAKDWLLHAWLDVCVKVKKKGTLRDTVLIDLYAGDGVNETTLQDGTRETWPGSSVRMVDAASQDPHRRTMVIINEKDRNNYNAVMERLDSNRDVILASYNRDAKEILPVILSQLDAHDHNFFFVDPYSHSEADVNLLRSVGSLSEEDRYKGRPIARRPEILYTFMTSGLQQSMAEQAQKSIDRFYEGGASWREEVEGAQGMGYPVYDGFLVALLKSVADLYPIPSHNVFEVKSPRGTVVYFMVFWATHPLAQKIFPEVTSYAYVHRNEDVIRRWVEIDRRVKALGKKGRRITDW
jgi:three-Cys-motif partner protein